MGVTLSMRSRRRGLGPRVQERYGSDRNEGGAADEPCGAPATAAAAAAQVQHAGVAAAGAGAPPGRPARGGGAALPADPRGRAAEPRRAAPDGAPGVPAGEAG